MEQAREIVYEHTRDAVAARSIDRGRVSVFIGRLFRGIRVLCADEGGLQEEHVRRAHLHALIGIYQGAHNNIAVLVQQRLIGGLLGRGLLGPGILCGCVLGRCVLGVRGRACLCPGRSGTVIGLCAAHNRPGGGVRRLVGRFLCLRLGGFLVGAAFDQCAGEILEGHALGDRGKTAAGDGEGVHAHTEHIIAVSEEALGRESEPVLVFRETDGREILEAEIQKLAGILVLLRLLRLHDHTDEPHAVLLRAGHERLARFVGEAGLAAHQGAAVILIQAACELVQRMDPEIVGLSGRTFEMIGGGIGYGGQLFMAEEFPPDQSHIVGAGIVLRIMQAAGGGKMRVHAAQFPGPRVHHSGKIVLASRHLLGEGHGHLIGGGHKETVEAFLHRHLFSDVDADIGAVAVDAENSFIGETDHLVHLQIFEGQQGRHQLGDAGGVAAGMDVLAVEDGAGLRFHQDGGGGMDLGPLRPDGRAVAVHDRQCRRGIRLRPGVRAGLAGSGLLTRGRRDRVDGCLRRGFRSGLCLRGLFGVRSLLGFRGRFRVRACFRLCGSHRVRGRFCFRGIYRRRQRAQNPAQQQNAGQEQTEVKPQVLQSVPPLSRSGLLTRIYLQILLPS